MLFQCNIQRLFQLTSMLFCWKETRLEIQKFYYNRFKLAVMENSECKANYI